MSSALGPSAGGCFRQQQARFEVGEPRRHHQIIGGELEPQLARRLDEGEILVGERQDRNLGEVDLLLARQRQQQIERAFEALDVDDQRRLVGARAPVARVVVSNVFGVMLDLCVALPGRRRSAASNMLRAPRRHRTRSGAARAASAASARCAASPASRGAAPATSRISSSLPLQWSTTSQPAASAARLRSRERARQGAHRNVVAHQQSLEADEAANHFAHHCDRSGGRCDGVDGA